MAKIADPTLPKQPTATNQSPLATALMSAQTTGAQSGATTATNAAAKVAETKLLTAGIPDLLKQKQLKALRGFGSSLAVKGLT
jgi:hypothetical protein